MLFKLLFSSLILVLFSNSVKNCDPKPNKTITVIGIAQDSKDAAVIVTDTNYYIIDGLHAWSNKYYGKKVKVTGTLVMEEHKKQSTDSVQV